MINAIVIAKEHMENIINHSMVDYPREACGVMAAEITAGKAVIKKVYRGRNMDGSSVSYRFDPSEQFGIMKEINSLGLKMAAIYHSHPSSPAHPSQTDINRAFFPGTKEENFPDVVYVIIGLSGKEPEVNAYIIGEKGVRKILLAS